MRRSRRTETEMSGQDSFLDIVANLVGILVILVMVIGVQAKDAYLEAETDQVDAAATLAMEENVPDVDSAAAVVQRLQSQILESERETKHIEMELAARTYERDQLQLASELAQRQINERKSQLNQQQQEQFDANQEIVALQQRLSELEGQQRALASQDDEPLVLEHLPTPLAKTVFGQEEHFRLLGGRLTYVPLRRLVEMLKEEAPHQVWKLKEVPQITETIGPIASFKLQYTLQRRLVKVPTSSGAVVRQIVELKRFTVIPNSEQLGETLDEALAQHSDFRQRLAGWDADETILTVWTYANSFDEFRRLKHELFEVGFLTAARPLPEGHPISGSPQGTRSAAQ